MSSGDNMEDSTDIFDKLMEFPVLRIFQPFYKRFKSPLLYLFFGFLTTVLNIAVFWLMMKLMPPLAANVIAWTAGVVFAYVTNRIWVFASRSEAIIREFISFCTGRLATLAMEELILWAGIELLSINTMAVKMFGMAAVVIGNYVISKRLVFSKGNARDDKTN